MPITVELGVYINYIYAISEQTMVSDIHTFARIYYPITRKINKIQIITRSNCT